MTESDSPDAPLVLIAEDDDEIRLALERILGFEGYRTLVATDGAAALSSVVEHGPDVIVLDVMMPYVDGLAVCRRLRERGNRTPILMLTARHEVSDRVAGLDAGADDYMPKPFDLEELLARLRALLRRVADPDEDVLAAGPLRLDVRRRALTSNGAAVDLTRTEFSILELLMRNDGIVQIGRASCRERV